ncbi:hypothetical protein PROFUN_07287 [Planoprotostelium fungivorum]|uniref:Uncharacterized protein n=1 Tax=Planoprotostelium fungivorum TaxID=1890364 RepID=A0A2P6NM38_9EUKA|nr:hypothetical protein PROFUN_07287 [Planoprotostelium fungivorum]
MCNGNSQPWCSSDFLSQKNVQLDNQTQVEAMYTFFPPIQISFGPNIVINNTANKWTKASLEHPSCV